MKKTVLISGGASGIGLATVKEFLGNSYQVFVLDRQPMPITHPHLHYFNCDVSEIKPIEKCLGEIADNTPTLDALVCNAGIHFSATIEQSSEADYQRVMSTNFKSAFFLIQYTLPLMKKQGGSIVLVGSDQTLIAKKHSALYGASKAALGSLAKSIALDYAEHCIRANLVAAGTIDTPLYHQAIANYCEKHHADIKQIHQAEAEEQPLGRIGQPEEVASLVYYLCTDLAGFITGAIIPIDGGYTAR